MCCDSIDWQDNDDDDTDDAASVTANAPDGTGAGTDPDGVRVIDGSVSSSRTSKQLEVKLNTSIAGYFDSRCTLYWETSLQLLIKWTFEL